MTQQQQTPKPNKLTKEEIDKIKKELAKKIEKANNGTTVRKDA